MYRHDKRIVITLDAGGTNFVFGAMRGCEYIVKPITMPSNAHDLDKCLATMVEGFQQIIDSLDDKPSAISFAFPGPADYSMGIIDGFLPNFPSFRDGVALGPFLSRKFNLPVFINNDGDLYAFGEALYGVLPDINSRLAEMGSPKQYHNLIGYTFGTGFGIGIVVNGELNRGDNSCVETYCLPHPDDPSIIIEEGVAVRAIKRVYGELSGHLDHNYEPKEIFEIAEGLRPGNREAAIGAFEKMGRVAGHAIASAVQLIDGIIVIGGGITAARKYIAPALLEELRGHISTLNGETMKRVQMEVFNLDDPEEFKLFANGDRRTLRIYGTDETIVYDPLKRIGLTFSKIGASKAISAGAYVFALSQLDREARKNQQ
ncbi:MAG: ROK family protein [Paramuribaculum sp.]|nr:ROK family protein [Paramuribaculum sp.]